MPKLGEALEVLFLGPREAAALARFPSLVRLEFLYWVYYLFRFLPLDIHLQGRPLRDRPFGDFRFGETPYTTALRILQEVDLKPGQRLVDLGCGRGKMVFTAALAFEAEAVGIDLLPIYVQTGEKISQRLGLQRQVEFRLEDFTLTEVFDADVIYIAGSIFEESTREELLAMVEQLQPGCRWVSVGWESHHELLEPTNSLRLLFSWGYETAYFYNTKQ